MVGTRCEPRKWIAASNLATTIHTCPEVNHANEAQARVGPRHYRRGAGKAGTTDVQVAASRKGIDVCNPMRSDEVVT